MALAMKSGLATSVLPTRCVSLPDGQGTWSMAAFATFYAGWPGHAARGLRGRGEGAQLLVIAPTTRPGCCIAPAPGPQKSLACCHSNTGWDRARGAGWPGPDPVRANSRHAGRGLRPRTHTEAVGA